MSRIASAATAPPPAELGGDISVDLLTGPGDLAVGHGAFLWEQVPVVVSPDFGGRFEPRRFYQPGRGWFWVGFGGGLPQPLSANPTVGLPQQLVSNRPKWAAAQSA